MRDLVKEYADIDKLVEKAVEVATKAHKGQFRDDGRPYITHPIAVANICAAKYARGEDTYFCMIIGLLHDVVEDTSLTLDDLSKEGFPYIVVNAIEYLTRQKNESYTDFIKRVAKNKQATLVKLADLEHNLSDQKPGARKDKYELATELLKSLRREDKTMKHLIGACFGEKDEYSRS